jgi:hypothetical protein
MSRVVAFGCSFTYGHGLEDCVASDGIGAGPIPSRFSWPSILADKMNLDCDNQAVCGLSNLGIVDKILNYSFNKDDMIIIMWTFFERDLLWVSKNQKLDLTVGIDTEILNAWAITHSIVDRRMRTWYNIHHVYSYLKSINANFYFLHVNQEPEFINLRPVWANNINFLPTKFRDFRHFPLAADGKHPGPKSHSFMASHIYQHINSPEFSNQS